MPQEFVFVLFALGGVAAGFLTAFFIQNARFSPLREEKRRFLAETQALRDSAAKTQTLLTEKETELRFREEENIRLTQKNLQNEEKIAALSADLQKTAADLAAGAEANRRLSQWIATADERMKTSFAALSQEVLAKNSKTFLDFADHTLNDFSLRLDSNLKGNNEAVSGIVSPVGKELKELREKVDALEKERVGAYAGLTGQVQNLQKQNADLLAATDLLNSTLKNNAQRGRWGEEQLRRIAELCGMVEHIDFEEQEVNTDQRRPDMVIHLTGERTVPVDSKVPMNAYLLYLADTDETERQKHLAEHARAVRSHIDALYKKAYWQSEERSVELVAMVVPYESGLSAAFAADREIFTYAMEKNVLLLSPMTFYAFLKSVSIGWQENAMSQNARAIAALGRELIARFDTFFGYFGGIEHSLDAARVQYEKALGSYNHRLSPTFERFKALSTGLGVEKLPENEPDLLGETL